jgi:hypothetical protein
VSIRFVDQQIDHVHHLAGNRSKTAGAHESGEDPPGVFESSCWGSPSQATRIIARKSIITDDFYK